MTDLPFHHPEHPNVLRNATAPVVVEVDACVIGSGAGGAVMAAELAEAGLRVALLEKGPYVTHADMSQRERDMLPMLYEDAAARTTKDGGFVVLHAHCVGGTTVVNNAICFRTPDHVLEEWAAEYGVVGILPKDLAPAMDKVEFLLNVQKITGAEINHNAQVMMRGAKALGVKGDVFRHNRTGCLQSGFCMIGCSYDRKQNMHITYVPRAISFGAKLYPNARVDRLVTSGKRIVLAEGKVKNLETGKEVALSVKAKVFVVAGGSISTPTLLLSSGLANSSDQVGRNLHCHPTAPVIADMGEESVHQYRGIPQVYYVDEYLRKVGDFGGFLLESISSGPSLAASMLPVWGSALHDLMKRYNNYAAAFVQVHDEDAGRVTVSPERVPIVDYTISSGDADKVKQGYTVLANIYLRAGAKSVHIPHVDARFITTVDDVPAIAHFDMSPNKVSLITAHQMGTCRMGEDKRKSVVDSRGKAYDLDNLYVADASVFPTAIGVNPQITIASLSTHFAKHMINDRAKVFG